MQIKITYSLDKEEWSDEEYYNQEEKTIIITLGDIKRLIEDKTGEVDIDPETIMIWH